MATIVKKAAENDTKPEDVKILLSKVKPGSYVRFPEFGSYTQALAAAEGDSKSDEANGLGGFWQVLNFTPEKPGKIYLAPLDGQQIISRDGDRMVVEHDVIISIREAKTE